MKEVSFEVYGNRVQDEVLKVEDVFLPERSDIKGDGTTLSRVSNKKVKVVCNSHENGLKKVVGLVSEENFKEKLNIDIIVLEKETLR